MRSTRSATGGLAAVAALTLALAACKETTSTAPEISVTVAPNPVNMTVGETRQLTAVVRGSENQSVTWSSDDPNVASVDASGIVTANNPGQVAVKATAAADAGAIGVATVNVAAPPPIEVTIFPANPQVHVGQTVQLTAQVSNTTNQTVSWSSQTPNLATVDAASGVVTGVAPGTAIIRATPAADPSRAATTAVTVLPEIPVTVVIQSITDNNGAHVDRDDISGQVNVTIEFDAPAGSAVSMLEVLLDDAVVCSQTIGSGAADLGDDAQAQTTFVCSIATDAYDGATGAPDFANGEHDLSARITTQAGSIRAEVGEAVTFNNEDGWVLNVQPANGPVADDGGLSWYGGGDVVVTGLPVLYSGETINTVSFEFFGTTRAGAADGSGFSATYSAGPSGEIENFRDLGDIANVVSVASAVYTGGQQAPTGEREWQVNGTEVDPGFVFRLDNEVPVAGTFDLTAATQAPNALENLCCSNDWVGAAYAFADGKANHDDFGVGVDTVLFYWGASGLGEDAVYAGGQVAEIGADLPETRTNTEVTVVAVVIDRLGNISLVRISSDAIGVDYDGPTLGAPNGPDDGDRFTSTGPQVWSFDTRSDTLSGFDLNNAGLATVIANFDPDNCVVGDDTGDGCDPVVGDYTVTAGGASGYYTMNFRMRDQAGNTTAASERTILMDDVEPTTSGPPVFPGILTGGAPATFGIASIEDDVDLDAFDMGVLYANGHRVPHGAWQIVGDGFGGTLVDRVEDREFTAPTFIRALQLTNAAGAPVPGISAATHIFFRGRDVAGNVTTVLDDFSFAGGTVPGGQAAPGDVQSFVVASSESDICDIEVDGTCTGGSEESTTLTAVVTGPSGSFTNPYARVLFFRVDQNSGAVEFIGASTSANQNDDGNVRTFTYSFTLNAAGLGEQLLMPVYAIAVTSDGDGLRSQATDVAINVNKD